MPKIKAKSKNKKGKKMIETVANYDGDPTKKKLTLKQEKFCQNYATNVEFYGNGLRSYADAYNIKLTDEFAVNVAKSCAHRLLTNVYVCNRINELLDTAGFNDENVKKQHLFLINQFVDLKTKGKMIGDYYKVTNKINDNDKPIKIINNITLTDEQKKRIVEEERKRK